MDHAASLGWKEGGPSIGDAYELQSLAERHYYLKVEHEFTAAEVEALLAFTDPLAVAQNCWEENDHKHSFPICEIMDTIRAYERFPLKEPDRRAQQQEQLTETLKSVLDKNFAAYTAALMGKSKQELVEGSLDIATTQAAYSYMKDDYEYNREELNLLLQLDDPLQYLASRWSMDFDVTGDDDGIINEIILELNDPKYMRQIKEAEARTHEEKPSILDQLHKTAQEADQRPPQEGKPHRRPDTPNL